MTERATVLLSRDGHVATVRLNRPDALNAFTRQMRSDLLAALREANQMSGVRVIVIGAEGRGFCSGADLTEGPGPGQTVERQLLDEYLPIFNLIASMEQTVIAAVPGVMAGIGAALAMHCDLSVMASSGTMVMAFTNVGLVPDGGASWNLLRGMGYQRAFAFIAEGGKLNAEQCLQLGLVNKLADADQVLAEAQGWAAALAERAPIALRETKALLRGAAAQTFQQTFMAEASAQNTCLGSDDAAEAIGAFFEKRKPVFSGK
ncbi:enoyl-CoA hydratase/isomerase family protein [Spongiibacter sp.]|uniref:enoyl-CoA hydratase/isomerase family protein n=1 Tax=Spongiibacter sp. TaxID=2024860 RepID=UPI00356368BC